jgi:hypothetical protein
MKLGEKAKKIIKWIIWGIGIIIAVILGKKLADLKLFDRNDGKKHWSKIPGKEDEIMMETEPGTWEAVKLPSGVKADDVKNAGVSKTDGKIKVEVKHEVTDRRGVDDVIDNSAYNRLRETDGDGS